MGRKRAVKPSWFKLFGRMLPMFEAAPDEVAGRAMKGILRYFDTGRYRSWSRWRCCCSAPCGPR